MGSSETKPKWPPGPWKWGGDADDPVLLCDPPQLDERGRAVAILEAFNGGPVWDSSAELQVDEDAKALIAAAPDLYTALDAIIDEHGGAIDRALWDAARAALKKARGETPEPPKVVGREHMGGKVSGTLCNSDFCWCHQ